MSDQSRNGFASLQTGTSDANQIDFMVRRIMSGMATASIVKVVAVSGGGITETGTVDVQIMVSQMDGKGQAEDHGTIFGVPYFRLGGGSNAVIIDPQVGDIGVCVFASRDISAVKANKEVSLPSSRRKFSYADGLYLGTFLGGEVQQAVEVSGIGIQLIAPLTQVRENLSVGTGATGSFTTGTGATVTVSDGIITNIY